MSEQTMTREEAQEALEAAQAKQVEARAAMEAAQAAQRKAAANVATMKAWTLECAGTVLLARAALSRLGGPASGATAPRKGQHSELRQAVTRLLQSAPDGMTVDEILAAVRAEGVDLAGTKPRENLNAYLSRWDGIVSVGRGKWGVPQQPAGDVPSFLAPHESEEPEDGGTPLPDDFPGREALVEAGFTTRESIAERTHEQLRRVRGVGAENARLILAALEG